MRDGYFSGDSTPVLVAKDRRTGMTFAAAVSMKGGGDPHAARLLAEWIDGLGCQEVTVRTDGEPSICEFIRRVRELRAKGTTTVDEFSPPGDSAGNGIVERALLTVGGLVRTTKAIVEENVLEGRDAGPRLVAWMVHHAAQVICACRVGADGLTPLRRLKVRKFGTPLAGFGLFFGGMPSTRVDRYRAANPSLRLADPVVVVVTQADLLWRQSSE